MLTNFSETSKISDFIQIRLADLGLLYGVRQTDRKISRIIVDAFLQIFIENVPSAMEDTKT
jgi:hypothetical protein